MGRRVRVVLRKDQAGMREPDYADRLNPTCKPGWAADGRDGCRWSLKKRGQPPEFDVVFYEVI